MTLNCLVAYLRANSWMRKGFSLYILAILKSLIITMLAADGKHVHASSL